MTPNLLFLYTDEQHFNTLAAYGNEQILMPNLNRLAGQACVFDRAYVTQPVCTPSRSSILTGLYPHTNGCTANNIPLAEEIPCLPEMLPQGRYETGHFGKWHLGDELFAQHGFDHWISMEDDYNHWFRPGRDRDVVSDYARWTMARGHTPRNGRHFGRGEAARLPEASSKPAFLAEHASRFIRENRDRPFCLYVNFLEPHMPFFGPRDAQYDPETVPLPANYDCPPGERNHLRSRIKHAACVHGDLCATPTGDPDTMRRLIARYWGLCSQVDTHCGTLLDTLDACGLTDRTIVVFTSDHGDMMGSHQLITKTEMFEESIRVPMLVRLPGQRDMRRIEGPVSQTDLVPTLLELMDSEAPAHLEGRSRADVLASGGGRIRDDVVIEWNAPGAGKGSGISLDTDAKGYLLDLAPREKLVEAVRDPVRTILSGDGRWKLCVSPMGSHELYDLEADPGECANLYGDADKADIVASLVPRLREWQKRTGDPVILPL